MYRWLFSRSTRDSAFSTSLCDISLPVPPFLCGDVLVVTLVLPGSRPATAAGSLSTSPYTTNCMTPYEKCGVTTLYSLHFMTESPSDMLLHHTIVKLTALGTAHTRRLQRARPQDSVEGHLGSVTFFSPGHRPAGRQASLLVLRELDSDCGGSCS